MIITQPRLARGFLGRSVDELARYTKIVVNLEAVKGPSGPRPLYDFREKDEVDRLVVMSDGVLGGSSSSHVDFIDNTSSSSSDSTPSEASPTDSPSSYARFHGNISTALPSDQEKVMRSGYAAFRTPAQLPTIFGRSVWDIDPYSYLAMRIRSDGRSYFINVQTEGVEPTDLHQHRLFAKRPGQWETILVGWNDFVRTNHGFVVEPQTEILRQRVSTVGIGLTDRVEGPFELCIERIWATNTVSEGDTVLKGGVTPDESSPNTTEGGSLKTRQGKNIHW